MNVSPDLEAVFCYAIVFALGLVAAQGQISGRLGKLPGQWIMVSTWLLFFAYTFVPVVLFWFLDRTNALHDTSLFGAVLVGFGYQQILSGGVGSIRAPGEVSKFWEPFAVWADRIAARIRDRIIVNSSQFDEKLVHSIRSDAKKFDSLKSVAMVHSPDPKALQQALVDVESNRPALGDVGVLAKQSTLLYNNLKQSTPLAFEYLLYKNDVVSRMWYEWYAQEWRSKTAAIAVAVLVLGGIAAGTHRLATPENIASYYVWRLRTDNGTDYDHFRAREKLLGFLGSTQTPYRQLTRLLTVPNLPAKTADSILSLLLQSRQLAPAQSAGLQALLIESLHTENSDIRTRIQKVLLYLAAEKNCQVPKNLADWQPDPKDTATSIDQIVLQWRQVK